MSTFSRIVLLIISTVIISCTETTAEKKQAIKKCWLDYSSAVYLKKSSVAWPLLSKATVNWYSQQLSYIRQADSLQLGALDFGRKLGIVCTRRLLTRKEIESLTPEKLFRFYVENDLLGDEKMPTRKLGYIKADVQSASAMILDSAGNSVYSVDFSKEGAKWKIDFVRMWEQIAVHFSKLIRDEYGTSEEEALRKTVEFLSGPTPIEAVWHPLK